MSMLYYVTSSVLFLVFFGSQIFSLIFPDSAFFEDGADPSRQNHIASDVDEIAIDEEVEPVRSV